MFEHSLSKLIIPSTDEVVSLDALSNKNIGLFSNSNLSSSYSSLLANINAKPKVTIKFDIDYLFNKNSLKEIFQKKKDLKLDLIVTTEDDWFKIKNYLPRSDALGVLKVNTKPVGEKGMFSKWIIDKVEERL